MSYFAVLAGTRPTRTPSAPPAVRLPPSLIVRSCRSFHESSTVELSSGVRMDGTGGMDGYRTKVMCTPSWRWMAAQSMQMKTPNEADAQVGFREPQSKQICPSARRPPALYLVLLAAAQPLEELGDPAPAQVLLFYHGFRLFRWHRSSARLSPCTVGVPKGGPGLFVGSLQHFNLIGQSAHCFLPIQKASRDAISR